MSHRLLIASTLLAASFGCSVSGVTAGERGEPHHGMTVEQDALGFGIQGEHFNGLPVDAGTIGAPTGGPAVKLDAEEAQKVQPNPAAPDPLETDSPQLDEADDVLDAPDASSRVDGQ